eukprot:CAMPEP_0172157706 /NCGR_PEP_ID=MMETSP1050-20130122/3948_1 /TAXON_ID=233186 /ORGANISM="Cryptomonas curvata, Strain CCAP979/52" /LENGTH=262 /DNA_ID=CAMNT_0012826981 /DNA_START=1001 /DNA_END=1786 /DNA_ORIENTATION=+
MDAGSLSTKLADTLSPSQGHHVSFSLLASILSMALGGFTAWWLLSSRKGGALKYLGRKAATCALTSSNIIDDIVSKISELLNRANKRIEMPSIDGWVSGPSRMQMISSQYSFEDADCSDNTSNGNSTRQSGRNETVLSETVTSSEASSPREPLTKNLVERNFSLSCSEQRNQLIEAVMLGDEAFVASALQHIGPESLEHWTDEYGNSLLILAVQGAQASIVDLLLRRGVDVDAQNFRGHTALHFACAFSHQHLADALRAAGA